MAQIEKDLEAQRTFIEVGQQSEDTSIWNLTFGQVNWLFQQLKLERQHCDEWRYRAETAEDEIVRLKTDYDALLSDFHKAEEDVDRLLAEKNQ